MKWILVAIVSAFATGCATTGHFRTKMDGFVGQSIDAVVAAEGYPSDQIKAPNGNAVYVYRRGRRVLIPQTSTTNASVQGYGNAAYGQSTTTTYGGGAVDLYCTVYFETGAARTVLSWHAEGNSCKTR